MVGDVKECTGLGLNEMHIESDDRASCINRITRVAPNGLNGLCDSRLYSKPVIPLHHQPLYYKRAVCKRLLRQNPEPFDVGI